MYDKKKMPSRRMTMVTSRRMTSKQMTRRRMARRRMTSKQMTNGRMTRMPLMLLPSLALDTGHINPVDNTGCLLQHWADHRLHLSISECVSVPQPTTQLVSVPRTYRVIFALYRAILHSYWAVYVQYWMIWHLTSNSFTKWVIFALYWVILHSYWCWAKINW